MSNGTTSPSFWANYKDQILSGLAGAGIGAGSLGALSTMTGEAATEEEKKSRLKKHLLLGAVLGGIGGVGVGTGKQYVNKANQPATGLSGFLGRAYGSRALLGATAANAGHAVAKVKTKAGLGADKIQDKIQKLVEEGMKPDSTGRIGLDNGGKLDEIRGHLDQLTRQDSPLSRLSQSRLGRNLGFSVSPGEHAAVTALSALKGNTPMSWTEAVEFPQSQTVEQINRTGTINGEEMLNHILKSKPGGPGRPGALPFIRDALSEGPAALHRANFKSVAGRSIFGALGGSLLGKVYDRLTTPQIPQIPQ